MMIVEANAMREMERQAVNEGVTLSSLMERAGTKVAELATKKMYEKNLKKITILCGTGNNGGDGFVAARLMSVMKCEVTVILADGDPKTDLAKMNFNILPDKVRVISFFNHQIECVDIIRESDIIIDAIYGIGFHGALNQNIMEILDICNETPNAYKIAVDLPSGAVCDTGEVQSLCFHSDATVTFTTMKPVHVLYPSMDCCGEIFVEDVGVPKNIFNRVPHTMKTTDEYIQTHTLKHPKKSANKGSNGTLLAVCGSYGMAGAAVLSCSAALRSGVGLVKAVMPKSIYPIAAQKLTEAVFMPTEEKEGKISIKESNRVLEEMNGKCTAVLIGCGLGTSDDLRAMVLNWVENAQKPMVIDADGLNALSGNLDVLRRTAVPIILTPHPGEMARLLGVDIPTVQNNRYKIAKDFAESYGVTVVLKGANTIVASPSGSVYVNRTGNNGMAKGGSGDVLAGITAALLAQGMDTKKASIYATYYHGLAGDRCAEQYSKRSLLPSDMLMHLELPDF